MSEEKLGIKSMDYYFLNAMPKPLTIEGVYMLYRDGELIYVGQSTNVVERVKCHASKWYDSYSVIECSGKDKDIMESFIAHKYEPSENKNHIYHGEKCVPMKKEKIEAMGLL